MTYYIHINGRRLGRWQSIWHVWGGVVKFVIVVAIAIFGITSCLDAEWYKESQRRDAAQREADKQPRVIREADGCKVYAFKSGSDWHYFTRCGSTVSTERNYSVSRQCGKTTCTDKKIETIVTEGNN